MPNEMDTRLNNVEKSLIRIEEQLKGFVQFINLYHDLEKRVRACELNLAKIIGFGMAAGFIGGIIAKIL